MRNLGRFSLEMCALNGMGKSYRGTSLSWILDMNAIGEDLVRRAGENQKVSEMMRECGYSGWLPMNHGIEVAVLRACAKKLPRSIPSVWGQACVL